MLEFIFSATFLTGLVLGVLGGSYLGVLLARRSKTANAAVDRIRDAYEREREELRQQVADLQRKLKTKE